MFYIWEIFALISKRSSDFSFSSWVLKALFCKLYLVLFDVYEGIFHKKLESSLAHCELKWTELPRLVCFHIMRELLFVSVDLYTSCSFWSGFSVVHLIIIIPHYLIPCCSRLLGYLLNYKKTPAYITFSQKKKEISCSNKKFKDNIS